jgi:hypothetical protein
MQFRTDLLALMLLIGLSPLQADNILTDDSTHDLLWKPKAPFKEDKTTLPEKIDLDDLQEFQVSADNPRFNYYLERGSLQTGTDGVTRFVVVIRSQTGATNTSYEAFRCGERLHKVYAYGSADKFFATTQTEWQTIPKDESTDYRAALYDDLVCNLLTGVSNPPDAIFRAMRDNRTLSRD